MDQTVKPEHYKNVETVKKVQSINTIKQSRAIHSRNQIVSSLKQVKPCSIMKMKTKLKLDVNIGFPITLLPLLIPTQSVRHKDLNGHFINHLIKLKRNLNIYQFNLHLVR